MRGFVMRHKLRLLGHVTAVAVVYFLALGLVEVAIIGLFELLLQSEYLPGVGVVEVAGWARASAPFVVAIPFGYLAVGLTRAKAVMGLAVGASSAALFIVGLSATGGTEIFSPPALIALLVTIIAGFGIGGYWHGDWSSYELRVQPDSETAHDDGGEADHAVEPNPF